MLSVDVPLTVFHPTVARWFAEHIGVPSEPQVQGWPAIAAGHHTLIAAPTGTGKTLAAFLWAIDRLLRIGPSLPDETQVLFVSPLKALGNDVQKNLTRPLQELRAMDPSLPEVRVRVRTGDTAAAERTRMVKKPPHIFVTTPESLYILLTSEGGRSILRTVKTVIVDEIHAIAGDKRGSHLALSLERLEALTPAPPQRIGLSATQKPVEQVAHLLVGTDRDCEIVDVGHRRELDLGIEIPGSPLETVCSNDTWAEIIRRMAELIGEHRTTLVFVNTRKLAERLAARLTEILGPDQVTSHHGSLARERRLDAEERLKGGRLRALVATASLELGIDIGEVDLVLQAGVTPSIAVFMQRVGRSGHALGKTPKGRLFPLTRDELVCAAGLLDAVRRGELDRTPMPGKPLDILAQQIVATCVSEPWEEERLFETFRRAWPYRELAREDFDAVVALHSDGRYALLHRDGVNHRLRATKRARITALTSGGAIPDTGQYRVQVEPEGVTVGSLDEDFAIESNIGDVFQLGNASWRVLKIEQGVVRVADAHGQPPSVPFWLGEGPSRTSELSAAIARVRERGKDRHWLIDVVGLPEPAADQLASYIEEGERSLGAIPTPERVVLERFFDESGGMQLVIHAPFGGRINRAWGLALRKRFCRGFGFELQAAANEEAIVISLGPQHSFPLDDVFNYLNPKRVRDLLVQALLDQPMFTTRWRWNLSRSLLPARTEKGRRVPTPLLRMRAEDRLIQAFPQVLACPETLPPGDTPVPWEHPIVRQSIEDCLQEAMDVEGLIALLQGLRSGRIEKLAVDTAEPSAFARGILNSTPYTFLDDAPLEERRARAVSLRLDPKSADTLGALDPAAVARVREEAWPDPSGPEELHEALLWMGFVLEREADRAGWTEWLEELRGAGRVAQECVAGERCWRAAETTSEPVDRLRGRLEALGPVVLEGDEFRNSLGPEGWGSVPSLPASERTAMLELQAKGAVLRCRLEGREAWCERRLLARIQRYTLERLRREIEPVTAAEFWRFLAAWQHAGESQRLVGPRGVLEVVRQLAGYEIPAARWESSVLPARVSDYRAEWLDELTLTGEVAWGRLWGAGDVAVRSLPLCLVPRDEMDSWLALSSATRPGGSSAEPVLGTYALAILEVLDTNGASFAAEIQRRSKLLPSHFEMGLVQLLGHGLVTCDSFGGLRRLVVPASRRRGVVKRVPFSPAGRWSRFRSPEPGVTLAPAPAQVEFAALRLLDRYGVIVRDLLERERLPVFWRDLVRVYRRLELRGEVRGGRFVQRFSGEQYALPQAIELMRRVRREGPAPEVGGLWVSAADPLNLGGILTPDARVPSQARQRVRVA